MSRFTSLRLLTFILLIGVAGCAAPQARQNAMMDGMKKQMSEHCGKKTETAGKSEKMGCMDGGGDKPNATPALKDANPHADHAKH